MVGKKTILFGIVSLFLSSCSQEHADHSHLFTNESGKEAFSKSVKLSHKEEDFRVLGKSFFRIPWVEAPSATTARDGLGPLFSANTCIHCHPNNGAGVVYKSDKTLHRSLVMRLSIPFDENSSKEALSKDGFIKEPTYGGQLSLSATSAITYEGSLSLEYDVKEVELKGGEKVSLHFPKYKLKNLNYGPLNPKANAAPRIALALVGLGAIEDIDEKEILKSEDAKDSNMDGISGKANWVYNPESQRIELGRFTWKAASASIKQQVANAAHNDMGLSNPLYPSENCSAKQEECTKDVKGIGEFDLTEERLNAIVYYLKTLKIPKQRVGGNFKEGEKVFRSIGCAKCHIESFRTKKGVQIHPYSDFLLHDMGESLSDGHSMFKADANEFRTPPLWGVGLYKEVSGELNLLHDGRAKSVKEAILWHGGEAQSQKEAFKALSKKERDSLVEFVKGV